MKTQLLYCCAAVLVMTTLLVNAYQDSVIHRQAVTIVMLSKPIYRPVPVPVRPMPCPDITLHTAHSRPRKSYPAYPQADSETRRFPRTSTI